MTSGLLDMRAAWSHARELMVPPKPSIYMTDPVGWVRDKLGETLWSKQRDIATSVVTHKKTAVRSCHNAGKSRIASRIAAWFIDTYGHDDGFIVSTAPTYAQVHAILWEEIRGAAKVASGRGNPLPGRVLGSDQWKLDDGKLVGWGRKPADADQHGFQGIHHKHMLVIVDEACGIPRQLWTAIEAITTGQNVSILAIGNPDDPNTEFGDICKPGSGWNVIGVSAFDTPNFTGEDFPADILPLMLSPDWVEDKRKRWGEESPRYVSKVLGQFPDIGNDVLISPSLIEAAQQRHLEASGRGILGVDVARYGLDRTVIYVRRGGVLRLHGEYAQQPTTETTGRVIAAKAETGADEIRVDGVGVGAGVVDQLTEQGHGVLDMQAGGKARDPERFANARAEWAWAMRQRLEDGDLDLDPADDDLAAQLGSLKYKYDSRGRILIESKDDMRKRGLPSPDRADAAILTGVAPAGADLFAPSRWRYWSWAPETGVGPSVSMAGRPWPMSSMWVFATAHLPTGEDAAADWTVVSTWARNLDGALILLDRTRQRVGETNPVDLARAAAVKHRADTVFVTRQQHALLAKAGLLGGTHITALDVDADPFSRSLPASAAVTGGKVWIPSAASWRQQWTAEHLAWPSGRFDGSVATLALAVFAAATRWVPPPIQQPPTTPYREPDFPDLGGGVDLSNIAF